MDINNRQKLVNFIAEHLKVTIGHAENVLRDIEVEEHLRKEQEKSQALKEKKNKEN